MHLLWLPFKNEDNLIKFIVLQTRGKMSDSREGNTAELRHVIYGLECMYKVISIYF